LIRGRVAGLCTAAVLAATAMPAAAATPAMRTLVVTGVPNAYAEVTFTSRVRLSTDLFAALPPRIEGTGTYGGAYVTPVRGSGPAEGTLLLRALPLLDDLPFPLGPQGWLPPGRYRVHLLGDGPTTVRIRVEGLRRDVAVRTRTPSDVVATLRRRGVAGVGTPVERTVVTLPVRSRTLTVAASAHRATGFVGRREMCVRPRVPTPPPCTKGTAGRGGYYSVVPMDAGLAGAAIYYPGRLPVGDVEAEFLDVTGGVSRELYAFTLSLN